MAGRKFQYFWKTTALIGVMLSTPSIAGAQSNINQSEEECQRYAGTNFRLVEVKDKNICVTDLAEAERERVFPSISEKKCAKKEGVILQEQKAQLCLAGKKSKWGYEAPPQKDLNIVFFKTKAPEDLNYLDTAINALGEIGYRQHIVPTYLDSFLFVPDEVQDFFLAFSEPRGSMAIFSNEYELLGCLNNTVSKEEIQKIVNSLSDSVNSKEQSYLSKIGISLNCSIEIQDWYKSEEPNYEERMSYYLSQDYQNTYLPNLASNVRTRRNKRQFEIDKDNAIFAANPHVHAAVKNQDLASLNQFISQGEPVNINDDKGASPLQYAAAYGYENIIRALLTSGANVNHLGREKYTPLHLAVINNNKDSVSILLNAGADTSIKNADGFTPYEAAALEHRDQALMSLVNSGANPNERISGKTLLHRAVNKDDYALVSFLLGRGSEINANDSYGKTPLEYAVEYKRDKIASLLRARGASETSRTKESDGSVLGGIFTGALVGVGIGAVVSGDVDPETLNQLADTLEGNNSSNSTFGIPTINTPNTSGVGKQGNIPSQPQVQQGTIYKKPVFTHTPQQLPTGNTNPQTAAQNNQSNNASVDPNLANILNNKGKAKQCITSSKNFAYNDPRGEDRYNLYYTNRCGQDIYVEFCQWNPPFHHGLKCDSYKSGQPSFSRRSQLKANTKKQEVTINQHSVSAGACFVFVDYNGQVYENTKVNKHGLSIGNSGGDGYSCSYTPRLGGTNTAR